MRLGGRPAACCTNRGHSFGAAREDTAMTEDRPSVSDKRQTFRALHASGCFAIPNPWDLGSACYLQSLGFKALASTSSGFAWSQARADNGVSRERVIAHLAELVSGTDIPINADFENGFAPDAAGVKQSVGLALEVGVAGLSIEDSTGVASRPLFEVHDAVLRIRAARAAMDKAGGDAVLVGRAECYLVGRPDREETIARLKAYANAGADCVYAPGLRSTDDIRAVVDAVAPTPFNLLVGWTSEFTMQQIAALGVRRVSVGGALARAAWGGFMRAARAIAEDGSFAGFADAASGQALNQLFAPR
jgi:2-methylisocitrate lyase-like PEP mutase family enzyme